MAMKLRERGVLGCESGRQQLSHSSAQQMDNTTERQRDREADRQPVALSAVPLSSVKRAAGGICYQTPIQPSAVACQAAGLPGCRAARLPGCQAAGVIVHADKQKRRQRAQGK